jgi:hypothetical protein
MSRLVSRAIDLARRRANLYRSILERIVLCHVCFLLTDSPSQIAAIFCKPLVEQASACLFLNCFGFHTHKKPTG